MNLNQLVCRAASAMPGALPAHLWDFAQQRPHNRVGQAPGRLSGFVVDELHATFEPEATQGEQIARAVHAMQSASDALADIAFALSTLSGEIDAGGEPDRTFAQAA